VLVETALTDIDPQMLLNPRPQVDDDLVLRHFACPGCGTFLDADICRRTIRCTSTSSSGACPTGPIHIASSVTWTLRKAIAWAE